MVHWDDSLRGEKKKKPAKEARCCRLLRLPHDLNKRVNELAGATRRSVNAEILVAIEHWLLNRGF